MIVSKKYINLVPAVRPLQETSLDIFNRCYANLVNTIAYLMLS